MADKTSKFTTTTKSSARSIDPVTSMNMPPPVAQKNYGNILHVNVDFALFFDRPSRNDAGQIDVIGTNHWKFKALDISMEVMEGLLVAELGQIVVEQTLRLPPGSRYIVDSANIRTYDQLQLINAQEEFVTAGAHYSLIIYRI